MVDLPNSAENTPKPTEDELKPAELAPTTAEEVEKKKKKNKKSKKKAKPTFDPTAAEFVPNFSFAPDPVSEPVTTTQTATSEPASDEKKSKKKQNAVKFDETVKAENEESK